MDTSKLRTADSGGMVPSPSEPDDAKNPLRPSALFRAALSVVVLVASLLLSIFVAAPWVSSVDNHRSEIATLDEKKDNVLALVTTTAATSAAISAIPDDTATPIAEKLADLSSDLMIVLSVIYLEKYLLTTLGYVACAILFPAALLCLGVFLLMGKLGKAAALQVIPLRLAWICAVFGIMLWGVIPASVWVTNRIDETYEESLASTMDAVNASEDYGDDSSVEDAESSESDSIIDTILNFFNDTATAISEGAQSLSDSVISGITNIIDAVAVMIVTSCLIPLLVLLAFFWLAKTVAGIDLGSAQWLFERAHKAGRRAADAIHGGSMPRWNR